MNLLIAKYDSPFVAVHFRTSYRTAHCRQSRRDMKLLKVVKYQRGSFSNIFHIDNSKYIFINRDVRDIPAELDKRLGWIQNSFALSGWFVA